MIFNGSSDELLQVDRQIQEVMADSAGNGALPAADEIPGTAEKYKNSLSVRKDLVYFIKNYVKIMTVDAD